MPRRLLFLILFLLSASAHALNISQLPLYIGVKAAKPNIMLLIDSSGSMTNSISSTTNAISPSDMPADYVYSCPSSNYIGGGTTAPTLPSTSVDMVTSSQGAVRVCRDLICSSSSSYYNFGNRRGNRCFNPSLTYNVKYVNTSSNLAGGPFTGKQLNWYFRNGNFTLGSLSASLTTSITRLSVAKQAAIDLVTSLTPSSGSPTIRMGLSQYNDTSTGAKLLAEIKDLATTQSSLLPTKINTISANGFTPVATSLTDIAKYFTTGETSNLTLHPNTSSPITSNINTIFGTNTGSTRSIVNATGNSTLAAPIQGYCQKSFAIIISDGLPNGDRAINPLLQDYTGDCATKGLCVSTNNTKQLPGANGVALSASGTACPDSNTIYNNLSCQNGTKAGRKYETDGSDYLDDVAKAVYEMDLRPSLGAAQKAVDKTKNNLVTYAIGLADPSLQAQSVLNDAASVGGGSFYFAENTQQLASALDDTIADIASQVGSSSSVETNLSQLTSNTNIFQAKFDSADWGGDLLAYKLSTTGSVGDLLWNAAQSIPIYSARNIYTFNPELAVAKSFNCANLSALQKSTLGLTTCTSTDIDKINYLRGDWSHEQVNTGRKDPDLIRTGPNLIYRNRTHVDVLTGNAASPDPWLLGDIVNSDPIFVGDENLGYSLLPSTEGSSYKTFVANKANYKDMLYIGANDGMLHGFDVNQDGKELFAYIPDAVYSQLNSLTSPNYSHQYSVDGPTKVSDAYYSDNWHTVLLGSTGAGAKALFAIDVTDPANFGTGNILWEINDHYSPLNTDSSTDTPALRGFTNNLGYTFGQSSIVRMQNGSWAAIVSNGYGSANNLAVLYIIDIQTGRIIKTLSTEYGGTLAPNGLSSPIAIDANHDSIVETIYAGDLQGNLWKFDVGSADPANWKIAYGTDQAPAPLFVACSDKANCNTTRQPITGKPEVGNTSPNINYTGTGVMVYFGTGKYFEVGDNLLTNVAVDSFYGIYDNGNVLTKSELQAQQILSQFSANGANLRVTSENSVNYTSQKGWYLDLVYDSSNLGERVVSRPIFRGSGRIVFETLIPFPPSNVDICGASSDGTSWLMELDSFQGKRLPATAAGAPWDITGDGIIDVNDLVLYNTATVAPSGRQSTVGMVKTPGVITNGAIEYKYTSGSKAGNIEMVVEQGAGNSVNGTNTGTRKSWRQLH